MNVKKYLTNPKRSYELENTIMTDPEVAYTFLNSVFLFDILMYTSSIIGTFVIWNYKPDFFLYYVGISTLIVYFLRNICSISMYIDLFIKSYIFQYKVMSFYVNASDEERIVLDKMSKSLPKEYQDMFSKL